MDTAERRSDEVVRMERIAMDKKWTKAKREREVRQVSLTLQTVSAKQAATELLAAASGPEFDAAAAAQRQNRSIRRVRANSPRFASFPFAIATTTES